MSLPNSNSVFLPTSLPIAREWYTTRRYADGISLVYEPHVEPGLRCNIWHIHGRTTDLLVDSGLGLASLREAVAELSDRPVLAVASHTHFDHIGNHHEFEQRCCHPAEAATLSAPNSVNTVWQEYLGLVGGLGEDYQPLTAVPHAGFSFDQYRILPAPPSRLIDEGDELDLGNRLFKVFHMPGHSPGSICLYEAATRTIFTGDVLYDGELLDMLAHSNPDQYAETLARLREIPADTFHCGHFGSFGQAQAQALIDAYLARRKSA